MARRNKQSRRWIGWVLLAAVSALIGAAVGSSPAVRNRVWERVSFMGRRLDELVKAIQKPTVPDAPVASRAEPELPPATPPETRPAPLPAANPSRPPAPAAPMENPIPESDKRKLERLLDN